MPANVPGRPSFPAKQGRWLDAFVNSIEEYTVTDGEVVDASGHLYLAGVSGGQIAYGPVTFTGPVGLTDAFLDGALKVNSGALSNSQANNNVGGMVLGQSETDRSSPDFDRAKWTWPTLGFRAYLRADTTDPDDAGQIGLYNGGPVWADWDELVEHPVTGVFHPTVYRATTARPGRGCDGLAVWDDSDDAHSDGWCWVIRKGILQREFWSNILGADPTPGKPLFVTNQTGDDAGKLSETPSVWHIGRGVADKLIWVDIPEQWGVDGIIWAKHATDPILAGQPVIISGDAWTLSCADDTATPAKWVSLKDAAADTWTPFALSAEIVREDWTSIAGATDLFPGSVYWLDQVSPGTITATPPALTGGTYIAQVYGRAKDERTLIAEPGPVIQAVEADVDGPIAFDPGNAGMFHRTTVAASALDDLTDVTITAPSAGEYLRKGAGDFVNSTIQAADLPTGIDATKLGAGSVDNTELGYLNGVTSAIQTQINGKANTSHTHAASDITSGQLTLARGGTGANLSATGGASQVLKQVVAGANVTVGTISLADLASGTLAVALNLPSAGSVTAGNRQVTGTVLGNAYNTPTSTGHYFTINSTEHLRVENSTLTGIRVSGGLPVSFAADGTVVAVRALIGLNSGIGLMAASGGSHTMYVNTALEYTFSASAFTLGDGNNIAVGTGTGTQIFTAAGQKGAFWGATPVVQQTIGANLSSSTAGAAYTATEQTMLQEAHDRVRVINAFLKTIGLAA